MQKEKLLKKLIFETSLFEVTPLSGDQQLAMRRFLKDKKIKTLNDLSRLAMYDLMNRRNAGTKTVDEIVSKVAEFGITICSDKIKF